MLEVLEKESTVKQICLVTEEQPDEMEAYPDWPYYNEFSPDYMSE